MHEETTVAVVQYRYTLVKKGGRRPICRFPRIRLYPGSDFLVLYNGNFSSLSDGIVCRLLRKGETSYGGQLCTLLAEGNIKFNDIVPICRVGSVEELSELFRTQTGKCDFFRRRNYRDRIYR